MAVLLGYSLSGSGLGTDDSIISSSSSEMMNHSTHELLSFHLNFDGTFDIAPRDFYDNISSASTPNAARSSELLQRNGYDTDDSGFNESLIYDSDLLQMSNLHLGDETHSENITKSRRSDTFPLPKLCLLSHFDEYSDSEVVSTSHPSHEQSETTPKSEVVDTVPSERISVRRQRSPDGVVERCSRYRLSLDSFSESRSADSQADRRCSDSFLPSSTADEVSANLSPPTLDSPLSAILSPPALEDPLHSNSSSPPVAHTPVLNILSPVAADVAHQKASSENQLLEQSLLADQVFELSPVTDADVIFKASLQCILTKFAPPCLGQLIGRKMGLSHVDIISELCDRSMSLIVRHICSYLTDVDICR